MRFTDDEEIVHARIDEWTVDVLRDMHAACARGPGAVFTVGDEVFEVQKDGALRPVRTPGRRPRPCRPTTETVLSG